MTQEWRSNRIEPFPKQDSAPAEPPEGLVEMLLESVVAVGYDMDGYYADLAPRRRLSREEFEWIMTTRGTRDGR